MYVIYDFQLGKVVKEGCDLEALKQAAKRYKHFIAIYDKYGQPYEYYNNFKEVNE